MSLFPDPKLILSLCDYSGNWPKFYRDAGYDVRQIDLKNGDDVRFLAYIDRPVHGILAAPPCTAFTVSGAQYWPAKDASGETAEAKALADACMSLVALYNPAWWALENPVGRLRRWYGPAAFSFDPCDFGGYLEPHERSSEIGTPQDAYTKKTQLWGRFNPPARRRVDPVRETSQGSWLMKLGGKSDRTKELRSMTPLGFAKAFFLANP